MSKASAGVMNSEEMAASDLPPSLLQLYPLAAAASKNEALILAQHVVLLEIGFTPKDIAEKEKALPKGWNGRHYSKIDYTHFNCKDSLVQVHFVPLGASVVVHGTVIGFSHETISLPMNANDYICCNNGFEDPVKVYKNYNKLSTFFKDNFAYKLLAELEDACGVERSFGLASIPPEVKFQLLHYLPVKSVLAMSLVNEEFHGLENSSFFWKEMMMKDFPNDIPASTNEQHNWKELYKLAYKRRNASKKKEAPTWPTFPPYIQPSRFDPDDPFAIRNDISMPPDLQRVFPHLARRMRPEIFPRSPAFPAPDPLRPLFRFM